MSPAAPAAVWKALARRLSPTGRDRVKVFDPDTREYLKTRRISDKLPTTMAAVYLYAHRRTTLLALDFDSKTHGVAQVDRDAERARGWLTECGARIVSDRSTNGGRHLLVPLAIGTTASFEEVQPLMRALQVRLPSLDIKPMQNAKEGCISVPGTPCAGGGYRVLDGSLDEAVAALTERSAPTLIPALGALMGILPAPAPAPAPSAVVGPASRDHTTGTGDDERLIEALRWTKPFPVDVAAFAATGAMTCLPGPKRRAPRPKGPKTPGLWESPSEARMAVVLNAVLRGCSLSDIRTASQPGGRWSGLGDSYRIKAQHDTRTADELLAADVHKVFDHTAPLARKANSPAHGNNYTQWVIPAEGPFGHWLAHALAWADHEFAGSPGRWMVRDVLQALAVKAALAGTMNAGTPVVGVGGRSVSLSVGLAAPTTVFDVLRQIREMYGSPIVHVRHSVGRKADFYALTTSNPSGLTPIPLERLKVADVHPAWSVVGRHHRLVHDLIVHTGMTRPADIYAAARVSARTGQISIAALATAGLVTRTGRAVGPGPVTLDDIAAAHHLDEAMEERIARFRRERAAWHDWLALQDQLRGVAAIPEDAVPVPNSPVFTDEDEYLAAVLAHAPPPAAEMDEDAALDLLADVLGARILAGA